MSEKKKFWCNGHMDWPDDTTVHVLSRTAADIYNYAMVESCGCRIDSSGWIEDMKVLSEAYQRLDALPYKEKEASRAFNELYKLGFVTHKAGDHYFMGGDFEKAWRFPFDDEPQGGFDEPVAESIRKEQEHEEKRLAAITPEQRAESKKFAEDFIASKRKEWAQDEKK